MGDTIPRPSSAPDAPQSSWQGDSASAIQPSRTTFTLRFRLRKLGLPKLRVQFVQKLIGRYPFLRDVRVRLSMGSLAALIVIAELITIVQPYFASHVYALGAANSLLTPVNQAMANDLTFSPSQQEYTFKTQGTTPGVGTYTSAGNGTTATAYTDASKGITVTDTVHNINFTMTPKFGMWSGKQDGNRIVYPLTNASGWAVYTMHSIGVKEDIVLTSSNSNTMTFDYTLGLGNNLTARVLRNGGVGIYGNTILSGNVSIGNSKDALLLQKARKNAPKNTLLFTIPAPVIMGLGNKQSSANASYAVNGDDLKVNVTGLKQAQYPLTIDPSIYIVTAQQFMQGNNETNIDFDVADKLIEKGKTSGARFNSWSATTPENTATWQQGVAVAGGYIYTVGGATSSGNSSTVSWAKFDTTTGAITSTNPGNGSCTNWCTNSLYNLPAARTKLSLVAYNGFLYAIGGEDASCTTANGTGDTGVCSTVYIAKLGANGEPSLWTPNTTTSPTYWYKDANLPSARSQITVTTYENYIYLLGGKTSSGGTASVANTAQVASITSLGVLGSWTTTTTLPYADYGYGSQTYDGYIYLIGGASALTGTITPLSTVYYSKINSDGTLNAWVQTTSLVAGRFTYGGSFTSSWGGYIYLSGGCTTVNTSGQCTAIAGDTQLASINADGSLDAWSDISGVTDSRVGHNFVVWRYNLYNIGGCSALSAGACSTYLSSINEGTINTMGDVSTVTTSVASGTAPCSGTNPFNCSLPTTASVGQMLNATAIVNGYLYVTGGCLTASCGSPMGQNTAYIAINNAGELTKPTNCTTDGNTLFGAWCVDSTHTLNPGNSGQVHKGVAAAGTAVFNNTIYYVGGFSGGGLTGEIYHEVVNSDGSLTANWAFNSMSTIGGTPVAYDYAFARANPASAGTAPGSLYIFGGCSGLTGTSCTAYTGAVYKCDILPTAAVSGCSETNQLQFGTASGASGGGIAGMGGTVYANYIYLMGGSAPGVSALNTVYYAQIDNNNNVVAVAAGGGNWALESNTINTARSFAAAYGYNGFLYVVGGYGSSGVVNSVEFAEINVSDGSIGSFTTSTVSFTGTWGINVPVTNSYAYIIAGCSTGAPPSSCSAMSSSVRSFQIYNNDSGAPAGYSTAANTYGTAANRIGTSSTIMNGYIYVAGGCTSTTDCTATTNNVSYASISATGALGTWSSTTANLPSSLAYGKLENAGGSLYYIGGQTTGASSAQTAVYYATPSSGNVSSWGTATNGLPAARTQFGAAVWNNRLYVLGGTDGTNAQSTVYVSPQQNSGGNITSAWSTTSTDFNVARSGLTVVTYANNIYVIGGFDGTNYLSDTQYAQISTTNGSVGSWTYSTSLPNAESQGDGFAANGYIYLIGGRSDATTCTPTTLVAPISANTTIASGNNPTGIGQWFQTSQAYTGARYGDAVSYSGGKAYVLGGACGSTLSYASPVTQQTALLSQPQVAQYSIMIDTDSDVFPNYWVMNGLDNSIGAEWQLKYESMTNPFSAGPDNIIGTSDDGTSCSATKMSTWGQLTNAGNVTLGTPGTYTPIDGSGADTNCATFYDFNVTVDSSQAFGYPDDVTRGPTITDLTLEFTANPSKRLMHGRTFTGGLQQPDDTPLYSH